MNIAPTDEWLPLPGEPGESTPLFHAMLVQAVGEVVELHAPWGIEIVAWLQICSAGDPRAFYSLLAKAIETPPEIRRAFLLLLAAEKAGRTVTGAA